MSFNWSKLCNNLLEVHLKDSDPESKSLSLLVGEMVFPQTSPVVVGLPSSGIVNSWVRPTGEGVAPGENPTEDFSDYQEVDSSSFGSFDELVTKSDYVVGLKVGSLDYLRAVSQYMTDKLLSCSKEFRVMECGDCRKQFKVAVHTCGLSYCWSCREMRTKKIYRRLMNKTVSSRRLFHMVIGSHPVQVDDFGKSNLTQLRRDVIAFISKARRAGYRLQGWYVPDFSVRDGVVFVHAHLVVLPFKGSSSCAAPFNSIIRAVTKERVKVVKVFGYRSKSNCFFYIAKRAAGVLGHYEDMASGGDRAPYGFKDWLSLDSWYSIFYRHRGVVQFVPGGISSTTAPVSDDDCPFCGSKNVHTVGFIRINRELVQQTLLVT